MNIKYLEYAIIAVIVAPIAFLIPQLVASQFGIWLPTVALVAPYMLVISLWGIVWLARHGNEKLQVQAANLKRIGVTLAALSVVSVFISAVVVGVYYGGQEIAGII